LGVVFVGILISQKTQKNALPVLGQVPEFHLTNHRGENADQSLLKNKIGVINFMFTTCQGICPTLNGEMQKLQKNFARYEEFQLVSISVDPENDTPHQLKSWTSSLGIDTDNWTFLTGPLAHIKKLLVEGLKVGFPDQPQAHTDRFVLVDRSGDIRGYYRLARPETLEQLRVDIFSLLRG
jgi:protein SCO1/2